MTAFGILSLSGLPVRAGLISFAIPALFIYSSAYAQSDAAGCSNPNPDIRIAACSGLMLSGLGPLQIAMALSNRSLAYDAKGDYASVTRDLDRVIALAPDLVLLFNNRCYFLAAAGQPEKALADCDYALASEPTNQQYIWILADMYISDWDNIARQSKTLTVRYPRTPTGHRHCTCAD